MKKRMSMAVAVGVGLALCLTGCAVSKEDTALNLCKQAAEKEVGASVDSSGLESTNIVDALFEGGVSNERQTTDDDALFTVAGDFTFEDAGKEIRRGMVCTVKYEGGEAGEADLSIVQK